MGKKLIIKGADFSANAITYRVDYTFTWANGFYNSASPYQLYTSGASAPKYLFTEPMLIDDAMVLSLNNTDGYIVRIAVMDGTTYTTDANGNKIYNGIVNDSAGRAYTHEFNLRELCNGISSGKSYFALTISKKVNGSYVEVSTSEGATAISIYKNI